MTLKSSETKNFLSCWISTILKSFLVSSACCRCTLPHFVRPMLRSHKIVPKITLISPEFNRSIIFSAKITMTKKSDQLLRHWIIDGRIISGSISVHFLSPMGTFLVDEQAGVRLCGFPLAFVRLAKTNTSVFNAQVFELHLRGFLFVVVVAPCCSNP